MLSESGEAIGQEAAQGDEFAVVTCGTSKGKMVWELYRYWSPAGYDRLVALMEHHFYDDSHFFRTVPGFLVQFGISYTSDATAQDLAKGHIPDDPQLDPPIPFTLGTISYAGGGPNSRTSQLFISLQKDGGAFGTQLWETPVGKVVSGLEDVVQNFYGGYGDMPPWGEGPVQQNIHGPGGFSYISDNFPLLDHFLKCDVIRYPPGSGVGFDFDLHRELAKDSDMEHHPEEHSIRSRKRHHHLSHKDRGDHFMKHSHHHVGAADGEESSTIEEKHVNTAAAGELHHAHTVHFNAAPNEEGLTKLSWELVASCLLLFFAVFVLWLRFALCSPSKMKAARRRKSK